MGNYGAMRGFLRGGVSGWRAAVRIKSAPGNETKAFTDGVMTFDTGHCYMLRIEV